MTSRHDASLEFVAEYYQTRLARRSLFPEARLFYEAELAHVEGSTVIDIGCGPHLYDDILHFGAAPDTCVGIDINTANLAFLEQASHPRLVADRNKVRKRGTHVALIAGDLLNPNLHIGQPAHEADCVVSSGCLGIFGEHDFKRALSQVRNWLCPGGTLVNLGWFDSYQPPHILEARLKTGFNLPANPSAVNLIDWAGQAGFALRYHKVFDVPDKAAYGWNTIQSCVWQVKTL